MSFFGYMSTAYTVVMLLAVFAFVVLCRLARRDPECDYSAQILFSMLVIAFCALMAQGYSNREAIESLRQEVRAGVGE